MRIKREDCTISTLKSAFKSFTEGRTTIYVSIDMNNGDVIMNKQFYDKPHYKYIGRARGKVTSLSLAVSRIVRDYNSDSHISKTDVLKRYGRKGLIPKAFIRSFTNCHGGDNSVKWYDRYIIERHLREISL